MDFDPVLLAPRRARCTAAGLWRDRTINDELDACVAECPDKLALSAYRVEAGDVRRFTYRELAMMADRVAVGLTKLGIGRNDVVAMQLPNWWQFTLNYLACSRIGAVLNPLMHIFRERELSFMLRHAEAKVLIVPGKYRGFDFERMAEGLKADLPALQHVVVVDGDGPNSYEALLSGPQWELDPQANEILTRNRPGGDDVTQLLYTSGTTGEPKGVTQLLYTSGTTGEPKGVMHTANTLMSNVHAYAERLRLTSDDVILMASPMAHQTGFLYGLVMPIALRASAVLQDVWEPRKAIDLIRAESVTYTMASTPFLTDLTRTVSETGVDVPSLQTFVCAGAPIPGVLVEQAHEVLGTKIFSAWGMTENGAVTMTEFDDPNERAATTDGRPLPGVEVKVVDDSDRELPTGEPGRLLLRACSNFGGYLHRPQWNNTTGDDWFDTGDLAYVTPDGYIRITGRSKDVIIRGGENIPVVEIESVLYRHPAVAQAAIIAYPDERLGERACAVIVPKPGQSLNFEGMTDYLKSQKLALQYIPERLIVLDAMPATASGKIQKFRLREMLRQGQL